MGEEPVNIDILLRQNVDEEADKATRGIDKMAQASEEAWKHSKEAIQLQQEVIARLRKEIEPLQAQFNKINFGTNDPQIIAQREQLSKTIRSLTTELKGEEEALKEMSKASDTTKQKAQSLETQMRLVREAMSELSLAGKKDTAEYRAKEQQLGTLATAYREVYQTQLQLSKGGANMQGIVSGLTAVSGMLSAGAGVLGLYNQNSEEYNKLQTKMQSLMAITIGLQQVQNTLHQTSAFRIQTVTKAKQLWTAATNGLTAALGLSNVAAKALMGTLTLGLSVAIGVAINWIDKYVAKQREAKDAEQKLNEAIAENSSQQIANYEKLRVAYNALGNDVKAKEQFIRDNQDAFKQLGVSINKVTEADSAFIENTEAFKEAIRQRAIATAAMELAAEQYKKMLIERQKAEEKISSGVEQTTNRGKVATSGNDAIKAPAPQIKIIPELQPVLTQDAKKEVDGYLSDAERKYARAGDEWIKKNVDADAAAKKIFDGLGLSTKSTPKKKKDNTEKERRQAEEKLAKMTTDLQRDIDAAAVAAMQEGREKKLKEIENDYKQRIALIEERKKELEEIEAKGIDTTKQQSQLDALSEAEKNKYEARVKAVNDGSAAAIAGIMNEIDARFKEENERRLGEIDNFYREQIAKAKENGATQAQLDEIGLKHKQDIELEKQYMSLETLDFEAQIALKKASIEDRNVLLESDRQEKLLRIQIDAAKKRLQKLQQIKAAGGDVDKEIAATAAGIAGMNEELLQIPAEKIREIGQIIGETLSAIGDFAGVFDEDLSVLFDMFSGLAEGWANLGSGDPKAMIQGAMQLLDVAGKIIQKNKEANAEIRKFNYDLAQQAIDYSLAVIRAIKDIKSETDSIFSENYTSTLAQGMAGYNAAISKQSELMRELAQETVKTGVEKKKFLGITYGTKDVYSSLLKTYPDLINKDGTLNRELAESLKKSGVLKEETSTLIDNILSAADAADEAMQSVESELQNLVGSIGNELKSVLDDAFASGTDSAKAMTDNVVKMLKELSTQKLYNAVFGSLFAELEDRMKESYGATGDKNLTDDIDWFMQNYPELVDSYNKGLAQLQSSIRERYGVDAFTAEEGRTVVNKGIAQASQDSIDELNGRITFITMKVSDIGTLSAKQLDMGNEQLLVMKTMLSQIDIMTENSEFLKKLNSISEDISRMQRDGITIKR